MTNNLPKSEKLWDKIELDFCNSPAVDKIKDTANQQINERLELKTLEKNKMYDHKPAKIETLTDLKTFIQGIPADQFCVDELKRGERCCILGHYCVAYFGTPFVLSGIEKLGGVDLHKLITVNNGVDNYNRSPNYDYFKMVRERKTDGESIKARLLDFCNACNEE